MTEIAKGKSFEEVQRETGFEIEKNDQLKEF